ncbi:MAG TPA: hypothetical protein VGD79_13145, partial [Thermoanaerobaculia bacterium]
FNEQAQIGAANGVATFASRGNTFNPFTETPRECPQGTATATCVAGGYHWRKAANFGDPTAAGSFQLPFTYRVSLGLRF